MPAATRRARLFSLALLFFGVGAAAASYPPGIWVDEPGGERPETAAAPVVLSARAEPFCIRAGIDTYRLLLRIAPADVVGVTLHTNRLTLGGAPVTEIDLHDDGSHGDESAGDHVFTADAIGLASSTRTFGVTVLRTTSLTLLHADQSRETISADLALTLHYIAPSVPIPAVVPLAADVARTGRVVAISRSLGGTFPAHTVNVQAVSGRYYELLPDDRDFLMLALPFNTAGAAGASLGVVRNAVQGIGLPLFDQSSSYGSNGALQGVAKLYWGNLGSGTLNHEIFHRWAAYLDPSLDLSALDGSFNEKHWGAIARSTTGFARPTAYCGVFDHLEPDPAGGWRGWIDGGVNDVAYGDLELYLMGLVGPSEVASPIPVLRHPQYQGDRTEEGTVYSRYSATGLRHVSLDEVIAAHGPRVPGPALSQKSFRSALVVVYDRPLTPVEMAYYEIAMTEWEKVSSTVLESTFATATGQRATMTTSIPFPAASVADALRLDRAGGGDVALAWTPSCLPSDVDYEIYEGSLGDFTSHVPRLCTTGGAASAGLTPGTGDRYYLVVPQNRVREGSYGSGSDGSERPAGPAACLPQEVASCP